jgi:glycosyltransferase involved in cell wall biosynthesis
MDLGYLVEIISDSAFDQGQNDYRILGVPVQRVKKNNFFFDLQDLSQSIDLKDSDIINWHCSDIWSSVYFWRLKKKLKTNIVWTLHSGILSLKDLENLGASDYLQLYKFWNNALNAMVPKFLIKKWTEVPSLRHVITLSKRTARTLKNYGLDEEKVSSIPSGVDCNVFKPLNNRTEENSILYFGQVSSFRGVDVLFSAFEQIRKKNPSIKMILLCRETNPERSTSLIKRKLNNVEIVTGILSQEELVKYLCQASIIVLPFKFWPQVECPLTILESMAMGKPVVTTTIGAIPEVIRNWENGVLVPPKNSKELANVILTLLRDSCLRERIGVNARAHVEHLYDWNKIVKDTLRVLESSVD